MLPSLREIMPGSTSRAARYAPLQFTAKRRSNASSFSSWKSPKDEIPALLTSTSTFPVRRLAAATNAPTADASETSARETRKGTPVSRRAAERASAAAPFFS